MWQLRSNYIDVHTMSWWERAVETKLSAGVSICERQYGFMPRESTAHAISALTFLTEKYREVQTEGCCVFVDLGDMTGC